MFESSLCYLMVDCQYIKIKSHPKKKKQKQLLVKQKEAIYPQIHINTKNNNEFTNQIQNRLHRYLLKHSFLAYSAPLENYFIRADIKLCVFRVFKLFLSSLALDHCPLSKCTLISMESALNLHANFMDNGQGLNITRRI